MVAAWEGSLHALTGVGCEDCHGSDHSTIFSHEGGVSAATCGRCHAQRVSEFDRSLHAAAMDSMKADAVLGQAVALINALHDEGLLVRADPELASSVGHALVLGMDQAYDGLSRMEQRFFDMFKFHHATTFKGAYHHSPDHTHNEGFLRMQQDLTFLRHEAARLRAAARAEADQRQPSANTVAHRPRHGGEAPRAVRRDKRRPRQRLSESDTRHERRAHRGEDENATATAADKGHCPAPAALGHRGRQLDCGRPDRQLAGRGDWGRSDSGHGVGGR